ncbi:MAG: SIS domain-containing protein [Candidatus Dormibacteria bacterium]
MAAFLEVCALGSHLGAEDVAPLLEIFSDPERHWFFEGQGRSGFVASMVAMRFMHLGRNSHVVGEATAPSLGPNDGLVLISGSGQTPTSVRHAEAARREGAAVVTVTYSRDSPAAKLADVVLYLPAKPSMQLGGSLFEQGALLALDGVIAAMAATMEDAAAQLRSRHTNLL